MDSEQKQLLSLSVLPARLDASQAAQFLGFNAYDLTTLIRARLLTPLGRPAPNGIKYFATVELEQLRSDVKWLAKATDAVQSHWRRKNHTKPSMPTQNHPPNRQERNSELIRRTEVTEPASNLKS